MFKKRHLYMQSLRNAGKYKKIQHELKENDKREIIEGHTFTINKPMTIEDYENKLYSIPCKDKKTRFKNVVSMILIPMISENNSKEFVRDLWYTRNDYRIFAAEYREEVKRSKYNSI